MLEEVKIAFLVSSFFLRGGATHLVNAVRFGFRHFRHKRAEEPLHYKTTLQSVVCPPANNCGEARRSQRELNSVAAAREVHDQDGRKALGRGKFAAARGDEPGILWLT